ncbi:MAG: hypothetical protein GXY85_05645 [Candidatus Brocadiaceae bacterium]|nr:hypothetical protein [Candidatus Brocadiaceae bacterium]
MAASPDKGGWTMVRRLTTAGLLCLLAAMAAAAADEMPTPDTGLPAYVMQEVNVRAAPDGNALRGTMSVRMRSLDKGGVWVPLFGGSVGVLSARASGGGWLGTGPTVMRRGDRIGLLLPGRGEYAADVEFATAVGRDRQTSTVQVPMVAALSGLCEVTIPDENVEVTLEPGLPYRTDAAGGRTTVSVFGSIDGTLRLTWKAAPEVREVETLAFAEQHTALRISPGLLRVESTLHYTVLQGQMAEAQVELPAGYSLLKVEGESLRNWDLRPGDDGGSVLAVSLLEPATARFALTLVLERTLDPVPVDVEAPQIVARGVTREKGVLAVAVEKGLQAEIVQRENIGQVNLTEMPDELRAGPEQFSLGLRYLARPFAVRLRVSTIEPRVYGEVSCLAVASLERFRQYWDVQYEIRNAGVFQLQIGLAPGVKLISLEGQNINNQSLDPATNVLTVDLRSKAEGAYRLGLQTQSDVADAASAVVPAVNLIGAERQWGTVALAADSGIAVETVRMAGITQIDVPETRGMAAVQKIVSDQSAAQPVLAFRYLTFPYTLALKVSHVEPELRCEPLHMVQITRKSLRYQSVFDYRIKKAGVFQLRLHVPPELRGNLVVRGPRVEDHTYDEASRTLTIQLTEKTTDEVRVEVETEALLGRELPKPGETGTFAIPAIYTLGCEQERGFIAIGTDESIRLKRSGEGDGLHDVDVQEIAPSLLQRARNARLAFRVIESPWDLQLDLTSISPKITAQTFNYVRFGEDYLMGASTIEFSIQQAGVNEFRVRLPEGVKEPNIRGGNTKIQERVAEEEEKPGELWRVELQSEAKDSYTLIFEYTMDLDPRARERAFAGPRIEMDSVEREIGYLAVTGDPSLELTPVPDRMENLTPVDEEEIPLRFRELPPSVAAQIGRETVPILFAFRYLAHPYTLALDSVRHAEADVVTAVVEACNLDTTLTREGNRITSMVATVRSRYQPFLEVELPEGARLWQATVNGRSVRPLTEATATGEVTKIPIAQLQGVSGPVQVELWWEELGGDELSRVESVHLLAPGLRGVRILRLGWQLQLPRGYRVVSSSGSLERLTSEALMEPMLRGLRPSSTPAGIAQSAGEAASYSNVQWVSNEMVVSGRAGAKAAPASASVIAGAKPQLPERFHFQGLILNPHVPAEVRMLCVASSALLPLLAVVVLVVFALCALLWLWSRRRPVVALAVLAAAVLVTAGIREIAEGDHRLLLLTVQGTIAVAVGLFGILTLVRSIAVARNRRRMHEAQDEPAGYNDEV